MPGAPRLLTAEEFERFAGALADIATLRGDTTRDEGVLACEILDRLARLRHVVTDPPDLRVGW